MPQQSKKSSGSVDPLSEKALVKSPEELKFENNTTDSEVDLSLLNRKPLQIGDKNMLSSVKNQLLLGALYFVGIVGILWISFGYATSNPKLAFAWLAVGILWSSIISDYVVFSSDLNKKLFTTAGKFIGGAIAIMVAYFISS